MHLIDSGNQQTVWHRLYAEARLPAGCALVVWLAASAEPSVDTVDEWHAHVFGELADALPDQAQPFGPVPRAVWERQPSELPGHPGLGAWVRPNPAAPDCGPR